MTWSRSPVRNYRDYLNTDFDLAFAQWIWSVNRGVLLPPGLDEQWLLSVVHREDELALALDVFQGFAQELMRTLPVVDVVPRITSGRSVR